MQVSPPYRDRRFSPDVGAPREAPQAVVPIRRAFSGGSRTAPTRETSEPEKIDSLDRWGCLLSHVEPLTAGPLSRDGQPMHSTEQRDPRRDDRAHHRR